MSKEKPLYEKLYHDEVYIELVRLVHYSGLTYRDLIEKTQPLRTKFGNARVDSATYHLVTFEGQMTVNPKPLTQVILRPEVRKLCFQLLRPAPESWDRFYRNADNSPGPLHAEKMAELAKLSGKPEEKPLEKPKRARKKK